MRILFASDLHGDADAARAIVRESARLGAQKVVLCGDLLGGRFLARRDETAAALALIRDKLSSARGNCDFGRDEALLGIELLPYLSFEADGFRFFVAHGHEYRAGRLPPDSAPDAIVTGHTHCWELIDENGTVLLNVGSASCPRGGNPPTYAYYRDGIVSVRDLDGTVLAERNLPMR